MSTQPATVQSDGYNVTSTHESAEDMTAALTPEVEVKPVEDEAERVSKAAAELGKKGGEAAAAKRAAEAKEAKKEAKEKAEPAEKSETPEGEETAEEKPLGKPRDDPRARMLEATRKEAEAKRERDAERAARQAAEQRLADLERRVAPKPAETPEKRPTAPTGDEKPKVEDFEDYADFVEARARHAAREEYREHQKHAQIRAQAAQYVNAVDAKLKKFESRMEEARKTTPDIVERTAAVADQLTPLFMLNRGERPGASHVVAEEVLSAENGPALLLHFADHPEELQRILALRVPPEDIKVEVRLIARGLGAVTAGTSTKPHVSKAPPPLRPVSGAPHTAADSDPSENDDYDTHVRKMNAKEKRAR